MSVTAKLYESSDSVKFLTIGFKNHIANLEEEGA